MRSISSEDLILLGTKSEMDDLPIDKNSRIRIVESGTPADNYVKAEVNDSLIELGVLSYDDPRIVRVVSPPVIHSKGSIDSLSDIYLLASGSVSSFPIKPVINYIWVHGEDNKLFQGDILKVRSRDIDIGNYPIAVYAVDELGNESVTTEIDIDRVASTQPSTNGLPNILHPGNSGRVVLPIPPGSVGRIEDISNIEFSKSNDIASGELVEYLVPGTVDLGSDVSYTLVIITPGLANESLPHSSAIGTEASAVFNTSIFYTTTGTVNWTIPGGAVGVTANIVNIKNVNVAQTSNVPPNVPITITPIGDLEAGQKEYSFDIVLSSLSSGNTVDIIKVYGLLKANVPNVLNARILLDGEAGATINTCDTKTMTLSGVSDPLGNPVFYDILYDGEDLSFSKTSGIALDEEIEVTLDCNYTGISTIPLILLVRNDVNDVSVPINVVTSNNAHTFQFLEDTNFVKPEGIRTMRVSGRGAVKSSADITSMSNMIIVRDYTDGTTPQSINTFSTEITSGSTYPGRVLSTDGSPYPDLNVYDGFNIESGQAQIYLFTNIPTAPDGYVTTVSGNFTPVTDTTELDDFNTQFGIEITSDMLLYKEVKNTGDFVRRAYLVYLTTLQPINGEDASITGPLTRVFPGELSDNLGDFDFTTYDVLVGEEEETYALHIPDGGEISINY